MSQTRRKARSVFFRTRRKARRASSNSQSNIILRALRAKHNPPPCSPNQQPAKNQLKPSQNPAKNQSKSIKINQNRSGWGKFGAVRIYYSHVSMGNLGLSEHTTLRPKPPICNILLHCASVCCSMLRDLYPFPSVELRFAVFCVSRCSRVLRLV